MGIQHNKACVRWPARCFRSTTRTVWRLPDHFFLRRTTTERSRHLRYPTHVSSLYNHPVICNNFEATKPSHLTKLLKFPSGEQRVSVCFVRQLVVITDVSEATGSASTTPTSLSDDSPNVPEIGDKTFADKVTEKLQVVSFPHFLVSLLKSKGIFRHLLTEKLFRRPSTWIRNVQLQKTRTSRKV